MKDRGIEVEEAGVSGDGGGDHGVEEKRVSELLGTEKPTEIWSPVLEPVELEGAIVKREEEEGREGEQEGQGRGSNV